MRERAERESRRDLERENARQSLGGASLNSLGSRGRSPIRSSRSSRDVLDLRVISPLRSPFKRFDGRARSQSPSGSHPVTAGLRRSRSLSPFNLDGEKATKKDNEFRGSLKLLLLTSSQLVQATEKERLKEPKHFGIFRQSSKKNRIMLKPHDYVANSYEFAQDVIHKDVDSSSSSKKVVTFQPSNLWSRAGNMFDGGVEGKFLATSARKIDLSAQGLFSFTSGDKFQAPLVNVVPLSRKSSEILEKNIKHGVAASSYQFHFMDGVQDMAVELRDQLDKLEPPVGCSSTTREFVQETRSSLSASLDKLDVFHRQATNAACYSSAFQVSSDVLFAQLRREQYISRIREPFKPFVRDLRASNFMDSDLIPGLSKLVPDLAAASQIQANIALADHLTSGKAQGASTGHKRGDAAGHKPRPKPKGKGKGRGDQQPFHRNQSQYRAGGPGSNRGRGRGHGRGRGGRGAANSSEAQQRPAAGGGTQAQKSK